MVSRRPYRRLNRRPRLRAPLPRSHPPSLLLSELPNLHPRNPLRPLQPRLLPRPRRLRSPLRPSTRTTLSNNLHNSPRSRSNNSSTKATMPLSSSSRCNSKPAAMDPNSCITNSSNPRRPRKTSISSLVSTAASPTTRAVSARKLSNRPSSSSSRLSLSSSSSSSYRLASSPSTMSRALMRRRTAGSATRTCSASSNNTPSTNRPTTRSAAPTE